MVLKWSDKCKKPHFFWSDNSIYSLTYILSGLHSTCTPGPQDLGYILSIHSTRINFNHEKKFLSRQKVGRKTASYAGVSAHLPGQGHRRMSSPPLLYQGCLTALEQPSQFQEKSTSPARATCSSLNRPQGCFGWEKVQNRWAKQGGDIGCI